MKLTNDANDGEWGRQKLDIAPGYLLDCFQCFKVRCDLDNSGYCSVCHCLWALAELQIQLQLVNMHRHCDKTQLEIKPIIHSQLGQFGRICLFRVHWSVYCHFVNKIFCSNYIVFAWCLPSQHYFMQRSNHPSFGWVKPVLEGTKIQEHNKSSKII